MILEILFGILMQWRSIITQSLLGCRHDLAGLLLPQRCGVSISIMAGIAKTQITDTSPESPIEIVSRGDSLLWLSWCIFGLIHKGPDM